MKRLALAALFVAAVALADTGFRVDNVTVNPVISINLVKDGGLTGHRDAGAIAMLECAIGGTSTRGCVEPGTAQTFTGQKTFGNGAQDTCVTHANLTACSSPNAGLHQCCSTHSNAQVWCNGVANIELTGSTSYTSLPGVYVNGILHSNIPVVQTETLPFAYTLTNISGFIAQGTGAGSLVIRRTDGVNQCDCAVDCDTDQLNLTCSGNCTFAASTQTVTQIPSDTCTTPPTVKGLLTPAGYRL